MKIKHKKPLSDAEKHIIIARGFSKPFTLFYKQTGIWIPDVIAEQEENESETYSPGAQRRAHKENENR